MSLGRVASIIFLYLLVLYIIIPNNPESDSFFVENKFDYLLPENNENMFKNINFKSVRYNSLSHGLVNGSGFNGIAPPTLSSNSYSYNSYVSTINSDIQSANYFQMNGSELQVNSNKNRINNNSTNDYSKIADLRFLAEVFDRGNKVSTSNFGQSDNNLFIGLQSTDDTFFNAPADNPGDNPEGNALPLSDDFHVYLVLITIYLVIKKIHTKRF